MESLLVVIVGGCGRSRDTSSSLDCSSPSLLLGFNYILHRGRALVVVVVMLGTFWWLLI